MIDAVAVLPVRIDSKRLPRKVLADLDGRPMLWHTWQQVIQAGCFVEVLVASDSPSIVELVSSWGGQAVQTQGDFRNGTERIASIVDRLNTSYIVNVQADMPLINGRVFHRLLSDWERAPEDVITPVYRLSTLHELCDPSVVKVVRTTHGRAIYFSRQPVPYLRDAPIDQWLEHASFWGHVGIYGFPRAALSQYLVCPPSMLELVENLEQLRFFETGISIVTSESNDPPLRIDTADDLMRARSFLAKRTENACLREP